MEALKPRSVRPWAVWKLLELIPVNYIAYDIQIMIYTKATILLLLWCFVIFDPPFFFFFFTNYYPLIIIVQLLAIKEAKQKYQNGIKLVLKNWRTLWREGETFSRKPFSPVDTERPITCVIYRKKAKRPGLCNPQHVQSLLSVLHLLAVHVQHFKLCPHKKTEGTTVWDGLTIRQKRKSRSPSICATKCDCPILLVLFLFKPSKVPTMGWQRVQQLLSPFITGLDLQALKFHVFF